MKALTEVQTSFKAILEKIGKAKQREWWKQDVFLIASTAKILDLAGVKEQSTRDEVIAKVLALDNDLGGFGANCSQLTKTLGRPEKVDKLREAIKGF